MALRGRPGGSRRIAQKAQRVQPRGAAPVVAGVSSPSPFAYGPAGRWLTTTQDHEVFICDGDDDHTVHVIALDDVVAGVRNTPALVLALDVRGTLYGLDPATGLRAWTLPVAGDGLGLAGTEAGRWAVVHGGGVTWGEGSQRRGELPLAGARFAAFEPSGRVLALVTADGGLCTVEPGGSPTPLRELGYAATGLCWSALGLWLVSTTRGIFRVPAAGGEPELYLKWGGDAPPVGVACSLNGRICAFTSEGRAVVLFGVERDVNLGAIVYLDREPGELEFGPKAWLGIGLGRGDGNKIDLVGGATHRTDPPPDRPINRWMVKLGHDAAEIATEHDRPAPAPAAAPAPVEPLPGGITSADPRTQWGGSPASTGSAPPSPGMLYYAVGLLVAAGLLGWSAVAGWYDDPFLAWLGVGILGISGVSILAASR